jgi:SulP family sulfate permease
MSSAQPPESTIPAGKNRRWLDPATAPQDAVAGLMTSVVSIPDGLASAAMAGVNPVYGLHAAAFGPLFGGLFISTQRMLITTTSASALAAGQAIGGLSGDGRDQALFLFVLLVGVFLAVMGLLKLGRLTRFVAHSVMTGFLIGVAVLLILDQLQQFVGHTVEGPNAVRETLGLATEVRQFDPATMVIGAITLVLVIALNRTRLRTISTLIALIVPSLIVPLMGWDSVALVEDVSVIPRGIPLPAIPSLAALSPELLVSALAVAIIIAVQGAGVGQSFPNRDGAAGNPSRDFIAQGAANLASGLFRGIPVGGSVGQTALNVSVGAQTRLAAILSGIAMLLILLLIPGLVGKAPMSSLAALMILAGLGAINLEEARSIWNTGWSSRLPLLITLLATLYLPIPAAVGVGVIISLILFISAASSDVSVHEMVRLPDGRIEEREPAAQLPSSAVTVLDITGSLFFAGARTLEQRLPSPKGVENPVVVLRLRGRTSIGATLIEVLNDYAHQIEAAGGRLYLSGVDEKVYDQLQRAAKLDLSGPVSIYTATGIIGESSRLAYADATAWTLSSRREGDGQQAMDGNSFAREEEETRL